MSDELKTLELAKVYENQGYYEEAFEIYSFLDAKESSNEIKAGLERMGNQMENIERHRSDHEENISRLFERWLKLIVLKQRLDNFTRIKSRLA